LVSFSKIFLAGGYLPDDGYLKDNEARKLFAQLVSGVGYLHKKGVVHGDLNCENTFLDGNNNIVISGFSFAYTFDPMDELTAEDESKLHEPSYIQRLGLDVIQASGFRRGDLMQTRDGDPVVPSYAAPEITVSDSLYTGRKADIWSIGIILVSLTLYSGDSFQINTFQYGMLAGYLPWYKHLNLNSEDANLFYRQNVSTPIDFPYYITPHARDLLRRILVPDPRKRADLLEVARHSWLGEYKHVVGFIYGESVQEPNQGVKTS